MKAAYKVASVLGLVVLVTSCDSDVFRVSPDTLDGLSSIVLSAASIGSIHNAVAAAVNTRSDGATRLHNSVVEVSGDFQEKPLGSWAVVDAFACSNCLAKSVREIDGGVGWAMPDGSKMIGVESGTSDAYKVTLIGDYYGDESIVTFHVEGGANSTFKGLIIYPGPH